MKLSSPKLPPALRKTRTHEWVDQRSLALSQAIAIKLRAHPELLEVPKTNLKRWIQRQLPDVPKVMLEWQDILDYWPIDRILELLTSDSQAARRLRQSSPFCGILSEDERLEIFKEYEAIGT
jgi:hypothetical protein